jgi:hypothetical protein
VGILEVRAGLDNAFDFVAPALQMLGVVEMIFSLI